MKKKLVLVNGAPASGKSTIVRYLRQNCDIVIIEKDAIKEFFFDYIGYSNREMSMVLGKAAVDAMFALTVQMFKIRNCVILENAFYRDLSRLDIERIRKECDFDVLEIYCDIDENVRRERFAHRAKNNRHPGHADLLSPNEATENIDRYRPLELGEVFYIDTTHSMPEADGEKILERIRKFTQEETS